MGRLSAHQLALQGAKVAALNYSTLDRKNSDIWSKQSEIDSLDFRMLDCNSVSDGFR
jgi:hypothetical protein